MYAFPTTSVLPEYSFLNFEFGVGLGYHISSAASRALLSKLSILTSQSGLERILLPHKPKKPDNYVKN